MKKLKKIVFVLALTFSMISPNALPVVSNEIISEAATIKISKKSLTLEVGKSSTLKILGTKKKINWKSSKKTVATVTTKGKITAKAPGTATITANVAGKNYTCKVTVKEVPNKYLKDAPYEAVEEKVGDASIVIPKYWLYNVEEMGVDRYAAKLVPFSANSSCIIVEIEKTGIEAPDYNETKNIYNDVVTQEYIQQLMEDTLNSTDFQISNFKTSDFKANLNTALKIEYTVKYPDFVINQSIYDIYIDNYFIEISVLEMDDIIEDLDFDAVAQYILNSIVIK